RIPGELLPIGLVGITAIQVDEDDGVLGNGGTLLHDCPPFMGVRESSTGCRESAHHGCQVNERPATASTGSAPTARALARPDRWCSRSSPGRPTPRSR